MIKYYKSVCHFYKVINEDQMIGIYTNKSNPSIEVYSRYNIYGEHTLLGNTKECSKDEFDREFDKAIERLLSLKELELETE